MKILCVADKEDEGLWDYYLPQKTEGVDLIISCGDLSASYLEFLTTVVNKPVLYVLGNHDERYQVKPPQGCICIEDTLYNFRGLRIVGLGGSYKYGCRPDMYTEAEMERRINKLRRTLRRTNGFDILVTHAPAAGYGDMEDLPHQGFDCFNAMLKKYKPKYFLHGHVHQEYGQNFQRERIHEAGTKIINCYDKYFLNINENEYPAYGKTGSFFYDWSIRRKNR